ncbi:MAG: ABC transporter permease subunit [Oscillochloris sp.]|nr:ABC transporter permease subunit [Oscillochloris sp.]
MLGSDSLRRDMLSRLIYGSRYTLLFCGIAAMLRVLIGLVLGGLAAWYRSLAWFINTFSGAFSAVPSLMFALIPLAVINLRSTPDQSVIAFLIVLSLTGWSETAVRTQLAVEGLRGTAFVEAAYAVGLPHASVFWRHVLPNLRDLVLIEAAYAMGATLLLLAELAFLGVFVGGGIVDSMTGNAFAPETITAEWGNMLAVGFRERRAGGWLFFEPLLAFIFAILACNLLAEGLRRRAV